MAKEIEDISFEEIQKDFEEIKKEESHEKSKSDVKINFIDEDYSDTLTSKKTIEDNDNNEKGSNSDLDSSEPKKEENKDSNKKENPDTKEFNDLDYQDMSEFIIEVIDIGISSSLKMIAKEKVSTKYEAPFVKKQKLIRMLAKILAKHQFGVSLEALFCITLVMVYYKPAKDAIADRMVKNEKEKKNEEAKIQKLNETQDDNSKSEQDSDQERIRKSGRPKRSA